MSGRAPILRLWLLLGLWLVLAFAASLLVGPAAIGLADTLRHLVGGGSDAVALIVREVRLPRALLALLVGGALGLSGAAIQGFVRNPLAEPGLLGVSASAALGAVLALYWGLAREWPYALPLAAIGSGGLGVAVVLALAGRGAGTATLILAGVAVSALSGALTALALSLAPSPFAALEIVFWLLGSLADRSFDQFWLALPFVLAGAILLLGLGRTLDALSLGEEAARSLGIDLGRARLRLAVGTALAVGAATAVAGAISFVGLVVPHLLRPWVGHRPAALLPASAAGGAILVLLADVAVRLAGPAHEMRLGVMTALVGGPFFLHLVLAGRRRMT